jgi:hypothetical protein
MLHCPNAMFLKAGVLPASVITICFFRIYYGIIISGLDINSCLGGSYKYLFCAVFAFTSIMFA